MVSTDVIMTVLYILVMFPDIYAITLAKSEGGVWKAETNALMEIGSSNIVVFTTSSMVNPLYMLPLANVASVCVVGEGYKDEMRELKITTKGSGGVCASVCVCVRAHVCVHMCVCVRVCVHVYIYVIHNVCVLAVTLFLITVILREKPTEFILWSFLCEDIAHSLSKRIEAIGDSQIEPPLMFGKLLANVHVELINFNSSVCLSVCTF